MVWFLIILTAILILLLYPIRIHMYTDERFHIDVVLYGFIRKRLNVRKMLSRFWTPNHPNQQDDLQGRNNFPMDIDSLTEGLRKLLSTRPFVEQLFARSLVEEFNWYSAIPMENPVLGLSLLPIYTSAQTLVIDYVYTYFKKVKDYDIDTKYNYLTDDILIYFNGIIRFNLLKILIVTVIMLVQSLKLKRQSHHEI
ncbi:MAG TPA: hypothetical protein VIK63_05065 [Haloplasmataceae bacterium]